MRVALPESSPGGARRQLRASLVARRRGVPARERQRASLLVAHNVDRALQLRSHWRIAVYAALPDELGSAPLIGQGGIDRKSPRLHSSHRSSSYAVFCWRKKKEEHTAGTQLQFH